MHGFKFFLKKGFKDSFSVAASVIGYLQNNNHSRKRRSQAFFKTRCEIFGVSIQNLKESPKYVLGGGFLGTSRDGVAILYR
jgi:hypothetical protein